MKKHGASILAIALLGLGLIRPAYAGQGGIRDGGNGGDAVVKRDTAGSILQIEMLDVLEARVLYGLKPKLGAATLSVDEKLESVFKQIERLNPSRARRYREAVRGWAYKKVLWTREALVDIPDSDHNLIPDGFHIEQIAIRQDPKDDPLFPVQLSLTINLNLWQAMDRDNQAALILHELFYWDTQHVEEVKNSRPARYLNALAFSGQYESMEFPDYLKLAQKSYLPDLDVQGYVVDPNHFELDGNGKLVFAKSGAFTSIGTFVAQGQILTAWNHVRLDPQGHVLETMLWKPVVELMTPYGKAKIQGLVRFDASGNVLSFDGLAEPTTLTAGTTVFQCAGRGYSPIEVKIDPQKGTVACGLLKGSKIQGPEMQLSVEETGWAQFDQNGLLVDDPDFHSRIELSGAIDTEQGVLHVKRLGHFSNSVGFDGDLEKEQSITIHGVSIQIDGRVELRDSGHLNYFAPKADFVLDEIPVASKINCGFLGSKSIETQVQLRDGGHLYSFVLSAPKTFNWMDSDGKPQSYSGDRGDKIFLGENGRVWHRDVCDSK